MLVILATRVLMFQSTPSGGKATHLQPVGQDVQNVSIHAFRGEGDVYFDCDNRLTNSFNPRLPGGRRPCRSANVQHSRRVSIHAFRGEGDDHAPTSCAESQWFQSTPSGGKATDTEIAKALDEMVSIHAFRGEGDRRKCLRSYLIVVSIHAFRGEGDARPSFTPVPWHGFQSTPSGGKATSVTQRFRVWLVFQSTPSGGKATRPLRVTKTFLAVSIHAFRGEGDCATFSGYRQDGCFNPRLPGGRRRIRSAREEPHQSFQSTPSGGKATRLRQSRKVTRIVSIHAFRGEGDSRATRAPVRANQFQSTPSGGKATRSVCVQANRQWVSIHAFRGEGDRVCRFCDVRVEVSIHAFRGEGDDALLHRGVVGVDVSIHAFRGEGDKGETLGACWEEVSIHAFRGEGDTSGCRCCIFTPKFQSTPSGGKAT